MKTEKVCGLWFTRINRMDGKGVYMGYSVDRMESIRFAIELLNEREL